jgi:PAS domain-containing protein
MAKTDSARIFGPQPRRWRRSALLISTALTAGGSAQAQSLGALGGGLDEQLGNLVWAAVTAGTAFAAIVAFSLFLRAKRDDKLAAAGSEIMRLRSALDRTEALLDADDQRTLVFESAVAPPQIFGGLPERAGAPSDKTGFLNFSSWLSPDGAVEIDGAIEKLRRDGEGFQLALRSLAGTVLEVTGRTSGRRSLVRFRELTGERRSFAELKEQATFVVNEMTSLRTLANILPFPLWRRNRLGRLTWVNAAYAAAVEAASPEAVLTSGIELLPSRTRDAIREAGRGGNPYRDSATAIVSGERRKLRVIDAPIEEGTIGCAIDVTEIDSVREELKRAKDASARILDQLTSGVVAFDKNGVCCSITPPSKRSGDSLRPGWKKVRRKAPCSTSCAPIESCRNRPITAIGAASIWRPIAAASSARSGGIFPTGALCGWWPCRAPTAG